VTTLKKSNLLPKWKQQGNIRYYHIALHFQYRTCSMLTYYLLWILFCCIADVLEILAVSTSVLKMETESPKHSPYGLHVHSTITQKWDRHEH